MLNIPETVRDVDIITTRDGSMLTSRKMPATVAPKKSQLTGMQIQIQSLEQ